MKRLNLMDGLCMFFVSLFFVYLPWREHQLDTFLFFLVLLKHWPIDYYPVAFPSSNVTAHSAGVHALGVILISAVQTNQIKYNGCYWTGSTNVINVNINNKSLQ